MKLLDLSPLSVGAVNGPSLPGMSSFLKGGWVHGAEALRNCRLDPQSTVCDVWEGLSLEPLQPSGGMRHNADLAVAQLKQLRLDPAEEWCAAVPSDWPKPVLQLFLGVAQECGLSIQGLFPRALAVAAITLPEARTCSVLEWGWKSLNVVQVRSSKGAWQLCGLKKIPEGGVLSFFRRESRQAAALMLERHRIDPLYSGQTEQALFNAWWAWHVAGEPEWTTEIGTSRESLSGEPELLQRLHGGVVSSLGIQADAHVISPAALAHMTGASDWSVAESDFTAAVEGLGLSGGSGPRWRDRLHLNPELTGHDPVVTHIVVDGIAKPLPPGVTAQPGEQITLPDGRDALAIHVPAR